MLLSHHWLSDYVDLAEVSAEALAELLTMSGLEVDAVERHGVSLDGIVVGQVLETRRHPNADRLTLCDVDLGGGEPVQIVCGAPNVAPGQRVPVALVGTTLAMPSREDPSVRTEVTLGRVRIRGEVSEGMICSEHELGLGEDASGIMVLDEGAPVGTPLEEFLRRNGTVVADAVFDVAITPNRPDATSHIGVARDVAAVTRRELRIPEVAVRPSGTTQSVEVRLEAPDACPRYVGLVVRGVKVGPSPDWLQRRLRSVGLRPINNVVDVTNYVMYEVGQPLHAFDLDRLAGSDGRRATIIVRKTVREERFTTLDDHERKLPPETLLICDAERPVAVAGVMGGANSEVTEKTTDLLIESAYFEPVGIRRTARALGLQTDSSYRFERGADPEIQAWAACRAAELIREVAGGEIEPVLFDAAAEPLKRRTVELRQERVAALLGVKVESAEIERLLRAIGFEVKGDDPFTLTVPSFRPDVEREVDVIEEIARLYGYDRIPQPGRMTLPSLPPRLDRERALRALAADRLTGLGLRELYTNSLIPAATAERFAAATLTGANMEAVVTANAINRDMAALRPSLLPGLLATVTYNQNRDAGPLRLFEFGHVFGKGDDPGAPVEGYREREALIIGVGGPAALQSWDTPHRESDFFDLKGIVEHLLAALGLREFEQVDDATADDLTSYRLFLEASGQRIAVLARLADRLADEADLRSPLFFAEIDWTRLAGLLVAEPDTRYSPISRHPEVQRDIALVLDRGRTIAPLVQTIREIGGPMLREVRLFDLYQGDRIEAGRKSVAFTIRFGADRTLTDAEVDEAMRRIVEAIESRHGATLRT